MPAASGLQVAPALDVDGPLRYDAALCVRLRATRCFGKGWELFARDLYQKAVRLTCRWIVSGLMFAQCEQVGRPVAAGDIDDWSAEDIRELAHEAVAANFTRFAQVGIMGGDWDHRKGASLFTYFMNGVVLGFSNVLRKRHTARSRWQHRVNLHADLADLDQADGGDYSASLARCAELLRGLLDAVGPDRQREVAELYFVDGLGIGQIAERLQLSEPAARSLLTRARQAMQRRYRSEEERHD